MRLLRTIHFRVSLLVMAERPKCTCYIPPKKTQRTMTTARSRTVVNTTTAWRAIHRRVLVTGVEAPSSPSRASVLGSKGVLSGSVVAMSSSASSSSDDDDDRAPMSYNLAVTELRIPAKGITKFAKLGLFDLDLDFDLSLDLD